MRKFTIQKDPPVELLHLTTLTSEQIKTHWCGHLQGYVDKLNFLLETQEECKKRETIRDFFEGERSEDKIYNNSAQVWNHLFYFDSLTSQLPTAPRPVMGNFRKAVVEQFGDIRTFREEFESEANEMFGSGWIFLSKNREGLVISSHKNANNVFELSKSYTPLLCYDLWEHAYYIDYRNDRGSYIENMWEVINWNKVEERYNNDCSEYNFTKHFKIDEVQSS